MYHVLEMEVASTNEEVSVAFNDQEELIIDCDVLPGWLFFYNPAGHIPTVLSCSKSNLV